MLAEDEIRLSEASIASLASLPEMEWRTSVLEIMLRLQSQVDENTEITADTQEVLNRDVLQRLDRVADFLAPAESFFRVLGAIGNGALRVGRAVMAALEFIGRVSRPLWWILALGTAIGVWMKGGPFSWPQF